MSVCVCLCVCVCLKIGIADLEKREDGSSGEKGKELGGGVEEMGRGRKDVVGSYIL